jgi:hypothetical protein
MGGTLVNVIKISVLLGCLLSFYPHSIFAIATETLHVKMDMSNDALAPVTEVYRIVTNDNNELSPLDAPHLNQLFSSAFAKLVKTDDCVKEQKGEVGVLDYDPFIDGQDGEVKKLNIKMVQQEEEKATVEATFISLEEKKSIFFDVVLERGAWRIHDIRSLGENGKRDSLFAALTEAYPSNSQSCDSKD